MAEVSFIGKRMLTFLFIFLFLFPFISSATDTQNVDDVFQLNSEVNYAKPCINNGTYCSISSICNFTVFNPDNTKIINNQQGTNNFSSHNITLTFNQVGIWKIDMVCNDAGRSGSETFLAQVTGSGFNDTFGFYILIIAFSFGIILLGFYIQDGWITILGTFGLYFLGVFILFNGLAGIKDLTTTWAVGIITLGTAMYISVKSAHEMIVG